MRRALVVSIVVAIAAALPVAANAAAWKGVVVAKDPSRSAVVTASRSGVVRTVLITKGLRALKIGQRVSVHARSLSDGTFSAGTVRVLGRASTATIRAVVVQTKALRTTVSAGGTVFALHGQGTSRRVQSDEGSLEPGDRIVADVSLDGRSLEVDEIEEVGHADSVKLEGHFVSLADGVLELRVGDDIVTVTIPDRVLLPEVEPGTEISIRASVGEDGSFTATEVWLDDDPPAESDEEADDVGEETQEGEHGDASDDIEEAEDEPSQPSAEGGHEATGEETDHEEQGDEADGKGDGSEADEPGEGDGESEAEGDGSGGNDQPEGEGDGEPDGEGGGPKI